MAKQMVRISAAGLLALSLGCGGEGPDTAKVAGTGGADDDDGTGTGASDSGSAGGGDSGSGSGAGSSGCEAPAANCDGIEDNGCEANLDADLDNCGMCGQACGDQNAMPSCTAGTCALSCVESFADCNGDVADGCEIDTHFDVNNCNGCGVVCNTSGGQAACSGGVCGIACTEPGVADCDGNAGNGCETDIDTNVQDCGGCNQTCSSAGGVPSCAGATCSISCNSAFANCNGAVSDGCEISLSTDPDNCGTCGKTCGGGTCVAGKCQPKVLGTAYAGTAQGIALTATDIYVGGGSTGKIGRLPINGGALAQFVDVAMYFSGAQVYGLEADATDLFFADPGLNRIWRADLNDPTGDYGFQTVTAPSDVTLGANTVYGTANCFAGGIVGSLPKTGGTTTIYAPNTGCGGIAVYEAGSVGYWANFDGDSIMRLTLGGSPQAIVTGQSDPTGLDIDVANGHIYWATSGDGKIKRSDENGMGVTNLAENQANPRGLAVSAQYVYWVNQGTGQVMRLVK